MIVKTSSSQKTITSETDKMILQKHKFNATKKIGTYLYLDDNNKKWAIPEVTITGKLKNIRLYNYSDILNFELIEDGNSIIKGGVGRAIAGGVLFGGVGAIVGGVTGKKKNTSLCSRLQIKITLNKLNMSTEYINLITTETKKDGSVYKMYFNTAQEIISTLEVICSKNANKSDNENTSNISTADEILKFKKLLDEGIITQEEFDRKKQELLK